MGQQYEQLTEEQITFITRQQIFFVGTAGGSGRINVSPKGMNTFRIISPNRVAWLNVTGSGNETAAHVLQMSRMTIMFCAFQDAPLILRLYGRARAIHPRDEEWSEWLRYFEPIPGTRQIFDVAIDAVQSSCGMAVPLFQFEGERTQLRDWAEKQGDAGIHDYWVRKNQQSIDGFPTGILD